MLTGVMPTITLTSGQAEVDEHVVGNVGVDVYGFV